MLISRKFVVGVFLAAVALLNLFVFTDFVPLPIKLIYILSFILLIPGSLLAFLLVGRNRYLGSYGVGLSIILLYGQGLLVNSILPLFGVVHPLEQAWIMPVLTAGTVILFVLAMKKNSATSYHLTVPKVSWTDTALVLSAITFPILALIGSQVLNNEGSNIIVMMMLIGIAGFTVWLTWVSNHINHAVYVIALYCIALALILMYATRSSHVLGYDIHQEYQIFRAVFDQSRWTLTGNSDIAYNSCLSIGLLPALLSKLLGFSNEYIFKVVMQLVFAIFPVILFTVFTRFVKPIYAYLAVFFYISQTWFFEQMPALVRQEIAFIFFGLVLLVIFDKQLARFQRLIMYVLLTIGMVVSHYSTSYVWLVILMISVALSHLIRRFNIGAKPSTNIWMVTASIVVIFFWETVVTHSSGQLNHFASNVQNQIGETFTMRSIDDGISRFTFNAERASSSEVLDKAYASKLLKYGNLSSNPAYYHTTFRPVPVDDQRFVEQHVTTITKQLSAWLQTLLKISLINIAPLAGLVIIMSRKAWQPLFRRSASYVYFALATLPVIAAVLFVPVISANYNLTRLFMQAFVFLALPAIVALTVLIRLERERIIIAFVLSLFFLSTTSFFAQITGGVQTISINQPGGKYDAFYTYDSEVFAATWLSKNRNSSMEVYADSMAVLRLRSFAQINDANADIFPPTIKRDSYVYLSETNSKRGTQYIQDGTNVLAMQMPSTFLDSNKDLVYSSGGSKIYR